MEVIAGENAFEYSIISLAAFLLAFLNPFLKYLKKKTITIIYIITIPLLVFMQYSVVIKRISIFMFSFIIATFCRSFTLHVTNKLEESNSEKVMSLAFFIAFFVLYIINVLKPYLTIRISLLIIILLGSLAAYFFKSTICEKSIVEDNNTKFKKDIILPLISLYLVYIGGGISYAGIYPYLEEFYYIDRFYNVLPLVIFMPIVGLIGKKYGNLINLFMGIIFLSISFTCFMFSHTIMNYFFIQTFLQIGWAFTNVFGFSYLWRLAKKYNKPHVFGYGIIFILLGVTSGSIIANFIVINQFPIIAFGPFTFVPLVVSLVFQFFYSDIKTITNITNEPENKIIHNVILDEDVFYNLSILNDLTNREKEIIFYYYNSYTAVKIADIFEVSPNTVRTHIKNSYSKLGVSKREQLKVLINETFEKDTKFNKNLSHQ